MPIFQALRRLLARCLIAAAVVVAALGAALGAHAADQATAPRLEVSAAQASQTLEPVITLLEDPTGSLGLAEVRAVPQAQWARPRALPLNLGYSRSVWWVRARLHNASHDQPLSKLLQLRSALQDRMALSVVQGDGQVRAFPSTGDREPFGRRPVNTLMPVFPLDLQPDETLEVFVRLAAHDGLHEQIGFVLWDRSAFGAAAEARALVYGVYDGLAGVLLIYSGLMFLWSRQRAFALYCAYLLSLLTWSATYIGHGLQYLWPDSPVFNNQILPLAMSGVFFFAFRFTSELLQLAHTMPRFHRAQQWLGRAVVVAALPALFNQYALAFVFLLPIGVGTALAELACGCVLAWRGSRQALWYVLAWCGLVFSALLAVLEMQGLIPPHAWMGDALFIGAGLQVLVLGIALADATDGVRREKLAIEQAARLAQEGVAARLEAQVRQRTAELEHANVRLHDLAITDALTGAFNRRHFNDRLEAELRRKRSGQNRPGQDRPEQARPALCLIDVDHFKAYNDQYGHAMGDAALKAVAATLQGGLRRADERAFRVGGEEFALILPAADFASQCQLVDGVRRAIEDLRLPHRTSAHGVLTASFGLVQLPPGDPDLQVSASAVYKEADRLLYAAKAAGRNRVASAARTAAAPA